MPNLSDPVVIKADTRFEQYNQDQIIKSLNKWERTFTVLKKKKTKIGAEFGIFGSALESINWINAFKKDIKKLAASDDNEQLLKFYKKADEEDEIILLHNINVSKNRFNLDVFIKTPNPNINKQAIYPVFKFNEMLVDTSKAKNNIDEYRRIIQRRQKLENINRKE